MAPNKSFRVGLKELIFEIDEIKIHLSTKPEKKGDLYLFKTIIHSPKGSCEENITYDSIKKEFINAPTLLLPYDFKNDSNYEKFRECASKSCNKLISLGYISLDGENN